MLSFCASVCQHGKSCEAHSETLLPLVRELVDTESEHTDDFDRPPPFHHANAVVEHTNGVWGFTTTNPLSRVHIEGMSSAIFCAQTFYDSTGTAQMQSLNAVPRRTLGSLTARKRASRVHPDFAFDIPIFSLFHITHTIYIVI